MTMLRRTVVLSVVVTTLLIFSSEAPCQRLGLQDILDRVADLEVDRDALQAQVDDLEAKLANVSVDPATNDLVIEGINLHVRNNTGDTVSADGTGNIIIGWNEDTNPVDGLDTRTGSHNLVIGNEHTFTSHSSIISGFNNASNSQRTFVSGASNQVSGPLSFVGGGLNNTANGASSFVGGGGENVAAETVSFVGGGRFNTASDFYSFVGGGENNTASGESSCVVGGSGNEASGFRSLVGGGQDNVSSGAWSATFNRLNTASGTDAVAFNADNTADGVQSAVFGLSNNANNTTGVMLMGTGSYARNTTPRYQFSFQLGNNSVTTPAPGIGLDGVGLILFTESSGPDPDARGQSDLWGSGGF